MNIKENKQQHRNTVNKTISHILVFRTTHAYIRLGHNWQMDHRNSHVHNYKLDCDWPLCTEHFVHRCLDKGRYNADSCMPCLVHTPNWPHTPDDIVAVYRCNPFDMNRRRDSWLHGKRCSGRMVTAHTGLSVVVPLLNWSWLFLVRSLDRIDEYGEDMVIE